MTTHLTLITSIILTGVMTAAGTYYVTTHTQPSTDPATQAADQTPKSQLTPVAVAVNQQPNQPVEITIKTEVIEKHSYIKPHDFVAEGKATLRRPQPPLTIVQGK
jgi:hypothetical protein